MKSYSAHGKLFAWLLVTVLGVFGCGRDSTGPDFTVTQAGMGAKRVYTRIGSDGTLLTLNTEDRTLRTSTGGSVVLNVTRFRQLVSLFEHMNTTDSAITKLIRDSRKRSARRAAPQVGLSGAGNRLVSVPVGSPSSSLMVPHKQSAYIGIFDGSDLTGVGCLDIAQNIYVATEVYHHVNVEYTDALVDYANAVSHNETAEEVVDGAMVDALAAELAMHQNSLNFLAVLYNSYDCWDNHWQDALPDYMTRFSGEEDGGGMGSCSTKWGTVEESEDGGLTWHEIWSGWYTECET